MFHPFYVKNVKNGEDEEYGAWKAASNLVNGDELLTEDGRIVYVKEVRIERLAESIKVYNLEVEGLHTYYVGGGVLVHNACGSSSGTNPTMDELVKKVPEKYKVKYKCIDFSNALEKLMKKMEFQEGKFLLYVSV